MSITRIYIARHGETEWNVEKRMQGQKDSPLTEQGRKQAELLREHLLADSDIRKDRGPVMAFSSALGRAQETLEICLKGIDVPSESLSELNEICLGEWEGLTFSEVEKRWPEQFYNFWHRPSQYVPTKGGERFAEVQRRMLAALEQIHRDHAGGNILVISHWIAIKTAMAAIKGLGIDAIPEIPKPQNGTFQIITLNDLGISRKSIDNRTLQS